MEGTLSAQEKTQKKYYNDIADVYDRHYYNTAALKYRYRLYDEIFESFNLKGKNVLDALCGGGEETEYYLKKGCVVTGLDLSEKQCQIYSNRFPRNMVICSSILKTSFPDETFDLVVVDSLHHIQPEVNKALMEIVRILKHKGHLLIWEPNAASFLDKLRKFWYRLDRRYFQSNEQSIDLQKLLEDNSGCLRPVRVRYGGNFAYLFILGSMAFRISPYYLTSYFTQGLSWLERMLDPILGKRFSCWVLALLEKHT